MILPHIGVCRMTNKTKPKIVPSEWRSQVRGFLYAETFTHEELEACDQFVDFLRDELPDYVAAMHAIKVYFRMSIFFADEETKKEHEEMLDGLVAFANEIVEGSHHRTLDEQ